MPFTNLWSKVIPAGPTQAKLIDDHIRQLRLDLEERLQVLFAASVVGDPDHPQPISFLRDPLVLTNAIIGKKLDKKMIIPFSSFVKEPLGKEIDYAPGGRLLGFTDSAPIFASIILPPGVTLKRVELMNDRVDAGSVTMNVRRRPFMTGGVHDNSTVIATVNNALNGIVISAPPDFAEVIADDQMYFIEIEAAGSAGNGFSLMGARLTYDTPSALMTL